MLEATGREVDRNGARPTIISRTMAIVVTAMYDAWAAYDDKAVGTRLGGTLRRPAGRAHAGQQGEGDRLRDLPRAARTSTPRTRTGSPSRCATMGYDPDDASTDAATPAGRRQRAPRRR